MANTLNWSLGHEGKGNVYDDGTVSTWNTSGLDNHPHHLEMAAQDERKPAFKFYLSPEGGLHDGGISFENHSPYSDDQQVAEVVAQHPAVWDGRNDDTTDLYEAAPRNEYGHAHNLVEAMEKVAAEEGWADFHIELKIPRGVRKQIRRWVDRLKWPEAGTKMDAREYHITILDMDEYDAKFAKWAREQIRGKTFHFESTGMDIFGETVVVRLDCPEWKELAQEWGEKAAERDLEPHRFPGGPKAHISIGNSPGRKWPQGIPNPHVKFDTRMFNINKNSMAAQEVEIRDIAPQGDGEHWLAAYLDGQVVGTIGYSQFEGQTDIEALSVHEPYRRMGIATQLVDAVKARTGATTVNAETNPNWPEGEKFWPAYQQRNSAFESTPDEDLKAWLDSFSVEQSQPPSLHHTDADQFTPQIVAPIVQTPHVDPPSKPYAPYNWAEEGFEQSLLDRTSTMTRNQRLLMAENLPSDSSTIEHQWPDGWSIRKLQNYGDMHREGELMSNCFAPRPMSGALPSVEWAKHPEVETYGEDEDPMLWSNNVPSNPDPTVPLSSNIYSLRDPDNLPHVSLDPQTHDDSQRALGRHNADPKPEYMDRLEEWYRIHSGKTAQLGTTSCPRCGEDSDAPICPTCGYDGQASPGDYQQMKTDWYDRAWERPGNQPRPVPNQPMHWRDDHAKNISLASGKDLDDLDHPRRWSVSSESRARESSDSMPAVWSGEQSGLEIDHSEDQSALRGVRKSVSGLSSIGDWHGF